MKKVHQWITQATLMALLAAGVGSAPVVLGETQTTSMSVTELESTSQLDTTTISTALTNQQELQQTTSAESTEDTSIQTSVGGVEEGTTAVTTTLPETEEEEAKSSKEIPIYRLYNPTTKKHLYTTDANEKNVLFTQRGWGYEGIGWYSPAASNGVPVYRLYNGKLKNHLYTTDKNEVRVLTSSHGWRQDNGGRPVFYSGGPITVYRLYLHKPVTRHHWTTDINEYTVLPRHGWRQEGKKLQAARLGQQVKTQYYQKPLPSGSATIANTASYTAIEADVSLTGNGTGHHAKLTLNTPTSAISFGMQYDVAARKPHTGKTSFMVENIGHNGAGGQSYSWTNLYAQKGKTYRLLLVLQRDGSYAGYIDGARVITGRNAALANQTIYPRVEGAARKTGDSIQANFTNIKIKTNGQYQEGRVWTGTPRFNIANGITTKIDGVAVPRSASGDRQVSNGVTISGTLTGLPATADWDTAGYFDKVSGLVQFY